MVALRETLQRNINNHRPEIVKDTAIQHFAVMKDYAAQHELPTFDLDTEIQVEEQKIVQKFSGKRPDSVPQSVWNNSDKKLRLAGAFYSHFVNPLLARGRDAHKPTEEEVMDFCTKLTDGGVNFTLYYALSKTQSPTRTGSDDSIIDFAEFEMLRHYSLISRVAKDLDLTMKFTLIDETDVLPEDDFFGLTAREKMLNKSLIQLALNEFGTEDDVRVRSLYESVVRPLSSAFDKLYDEKYAQLDTVTREQLASGEATALTIRIFTFLDCMPNTGLANLGLSPEEITQIRVAGKSVDLNNLPHPLKEYLISLTTHVATIMDLRGQAAEQILLSGNDDDFPEYSNDKVYGGVTRSASRWSIMPHPIKWKGEVRNPMHGLATYDHAKQYRGVATFNHLNQLQDARECDIIYHGTKPIFALVHSSRRN